MFNELDHAARDPNYKPRFTGDPLDQTGISQCDIVLYFTFFEELYRVVRTGLLRIEDIDDCFSARFFKFIHNVYIQENELYQEASAYSNVFELYSIWKKHHVTKMTSPKKINSFLENEIPELYLENRTYLQDVWSIGDRCLLEQRFHFVNLSQKASANGFRKFVFRRLFPRDISGIIQLQNEIIKELPDQDLFVESTKHEFLESMLIDFCYGLFLDDRLVTQCVIVLNRNDERNMILDFSEEVSKKFAGSCSYIDCITFDTIQVSPEYRGYGIQSFFLSIAETLADMLGAKFIMASVSPANSYSINNFLRHGYTVLTTLHMNKGVYQNKMRDIMLKDADPS